MKKLLIFDVENVLITPFRHHHSYFMNAIAHALSPGAVQDELAGKQKYKNKEPGYKTYADWTRETIYMHQKHKLTKTLLDQVINRAEYRDGVEKFFEHLDRDKYIPILNSGTCQELIGRMVVDLGIPCDDTFSAFKYGFNKNGQIERDLLIINARSPKGTHEFIQIALRKYGLNDNDWIYVHNGYENERAKSAPVSICVNPDAEISNKWEHSYGNFFDLINSDKKFGFYSDKKNPKIEYKEPSCFEEAQELVDIRLGSIAENIDKLESEAFERVLSKKRNNDIRGYVSMADFSGTKNLLSWGELVLVLGKKNMPDNMFPAALLSPFSNAIEVMINVCLAHIGNYSTLEKLIEKNKNEEKYILDHLGNDVLQTAIINYKYMRNMSAHTSSEVTIDVANAFIKRTYELVQRLELIIAEHNSALSR